MTTGIRIDLRIEHQGIDVAAGSQHMVKATVADIISPAVATNQPHRLLDQIIGQGQQLFGGGAGATFKNRLQLVDLLPLDIDGFLGRLIAVLDLGHQLLRFAATVASAGQQLVNQFIGEGLELVNAEADTVTELGGVLEQRVVPGRAEAVLAGGPGGGRQVAAVDGRAAGGVAHDQPVAIELGQQLDERRLAAAGAGAGKFKGRRQQLATLDRRPVEQRRISVGQIQEEIPVDGFLLTQRHLEFHIDRLVLRIFLALDRAIVNTSATTGTILRGHLQGELLAFEPFATGIAGLESCRRSLQLIRIIDRHANSGMGAHKGAKTALYTQLRIPHRNIHCDVALFVLGGIGGKGTVGRHGRHGQLVAEPGDNLGGDVLDELGSLAFDSFLHGDGAVGRSRHRHLLNMLQSRVNSLVVHGHDLFAGFAVALGDRCPDLGYRLVLRYNPGNRKKAGLHDDIDTSAKADLATQANTINYIELKLFCDNFLLHLKGQLSPDLFLVIGTIKQKGCSLLSLIEHVVLLKEGEVVAGNKIGGVDQIRRTDCFTAETQVADGYATRLLRVVDEVSLHLVICCIADDLDGVLIGADGTIGTKTVEHSGVAFARHFEGRVVIEAGTGHVVVDAEGEVVFRLGLSQVVEHRLDQRRGELLGAETVTAADDGRVVGQFDQALAHGFANGGTNVLVEGFTKGAGFLGAVEHGNFFHRFRQRLGQNLDRKGHEQADLEQADLLALRDQIVDQLVSGIGT